MKKLIYSTELETKLKELEKSFNENRSQIEEIVLSCLLPLPNKDSNSVSMYLEDLEWDWNSRNKLINHILTSEKKEFYYDLLKGRI